ncbi:hypothetical protein [Botryobacter ruber]|uniref:hypothetical protein n=1 Tax=Botryobacter ruber TaxID=2171629 RepID=UPI000E0B9C0C|nr:hypothetical protein [Botryobacter ruber]
MHILHTTPGDANFYLFEELPKRLYPADSLRHTQSDNLNQEFLDTCFVLTVDGEPKARAALYRNPNLVYEGKQAACVGNYECVEEEEVAEAMLNYVAGKAMEAGAAYLLGPMNGSTWDNYRFSSHHSHANFLLEPYHHLYYNQQFAATGFSPVARYTSSLDTDVVCDHPAIVKREAELMAAGVTFRPIHMADYEGELARLYPFITGAFKSNFLYTPISWESFRKKYLEAARIITPDHVLLAEDPERNIIGLIFCYDDLYNTSEKSLVVKTLARHESKEWAGLGQVLGNQIMRAAKAKSYRSLIHAFTIATGASTVTSKTFHGNVYKSYTLYGKEL